MKNNKSKIWLFLLVAMVSFLFVGKNVYAEEGDNVPKKVRFYTTVSGWKNNNDLAYTCGSASTDNGTTPPTAKVYYATYDGMNMGTLQETTCSFNLSDLGWTVGTTYRIVEEYDFTNYVGVDPEYESITINPGRVTSNMFDDDDAIFLDYEPTEEETAFVYNLNQVDEATGIITGGLYVHQVHLSDDPENPSEGEKEADKSFGTIYIPTYCVRLTFSARGNVASTYGTFVFNLLGLTDNNITTGVTGGDNLPITVCELGGEPLSIDDIDGIMNPNIDPDNPENSDLRYVGVNHADDYQLSVLNEDDDIIADGNTIIKPLDVVAYLNSDLSQTGLVYRVIPFIVLIGLMVSGYIVIRKNKIKE